MAADNEEPPNEAEEAHSKEPDKAGEEANNKGNTMTTEADEVAVADGSAGETTTSNNGIATPRSTSVQIGS